LVRNEANDHPAPIRHEAGRPELAHRGVDDRVARAAGLPGVDRLVVRPPRQALELAAERVVQDVRVVPQDMGVEVAPDELLDEDPSSLARAGGALDDLQRGQQPPAKVLREAGCRPVDEPIAGPRVARHAVVEPPLEAPSRGGLAGFEEVTGIRGGTVDPEVLERRQVGGRVAGPAGGPGSALGWARQGRSDAGAPAMLGDTANTR
jgi:hypothetical protein